MLIKLNLLSNFSYSLSLFLLVIIVNSIILMVNLNSVSNFKYRKMYISLSINATRRIMNKIENKTTTTITRTILKISYLIQIELCQKCL